MSAGRMGQASLPCGEYLGDNDGTCPQLTCIRPRGHDGPHDNVSAEDERRAPVQGDGPYRTPPDNWMRKKYPTKEPGTIAWSEHLEVWEEYAKKYGRDQSAERLAERGGFGFFEAEKILGRPLRTWRANGAEKGGNADG